MSKIYNINELKKVRSIWKNKNEKVVFTNGVFDILHRGHVDYLIKAKKLGKHLIVAINSDRSVKKIKGPLRPINNEKDRGFILSELKSVCAVIIFNEETPLNTIKILLPDILVKGGDWKKEKIIGGKEVIKNGGSVKTIKYLDGKSTTGTIEKIIDRFKK